MRVFCVPISTDFLLIAMETPVNWDWFSTKAGYFQEIRLNFLLNGTVIQVTEPGFEEYSSHVDQAKVNIPSMTIHALTWKRGGVKFQ